MRIHVEGMGVSGALLAVQLERHGVDFTWHDTEQKVSAWRASTGAVYPANSEKFGPDWACWQVWQRWYHEGLYDPHTERANFWFGHKGRPPHEGRYPVHEPASEHGLRQAVPSSFHVNAQSLVPWARERYSHRRLPTAPGDESHLIISHGWGRRLGHVYWGWAALIELAYDRSVYGAGDRRPALYLRPSRVEMAYAYPVPGTPYWYAGSSIIKQRLEGIKELEVEGKYQRWLRLLERYSGGAMEIVGRSEVLQGWRPAAAVEDTAWLRVAPMPRGRVGTVMTLRPLWNSGIRHFPKQWAAVAAQLGIVDSNLEGVR